MLREKEKVVQNFLAIVDVIIAIVAFNIALYIHFERFDYLHDKDAVILHFVILTAWYVLSKVFRMNEIYRSRPYSVLMLNVFATTILGSALVGLVEFVFELYYIGFEPIITFAGFVLTSYSIHYTKLYEIIMAGGIGSRFWPMSTSETPKQFLDILGTGKTMIQQTVERFDGIVPVENVFIVTSASYKEIIKEQLPGVPISQVLLEPCMRNTAPCIAYAAYKIKLKDPNANIVVAPSDLV